MLAVMQLPPGQQLVSPAKWPLVGERTAQVPASGWTIRVGGLVDAPCVMSPVDLRALRQIERTVDIHCVTRWSKPAVRFGGVLLSDLLDHTRARANARFVSFAAHSARGHSTSLVLSEAVELGTLLALDCEGLPLALEHGGPVRVVVPGRYFYKSLKWLAQVELLAEDRLGYWEGTAGYHNHADPWREERYMAAGLTKAEAAAILAKRDWSNRELRSIDASGRELRGLFACGAILRDADFRGCDLREADFSQANLSNAHFQGADLRGANFTGADCEGADFGRADLRGADFGGASLFGASFGGESDDIGLDSDLALLDGSTQLDAGAIEQLTPKQQEFVRRLLG